MSCDCCVALPLSAMGLSAFCDKVFPDHTHLLIWVRMKCSSLSETNDLGSFVDLK